MFPCLFKIIPKLSLVLLFLFGPFFILHTNAEGYIPLAPIPGLTDGEGIGSSDKSLSTYFQNLYKFGVGVATALALFMVIYGGVEYVSTDAIGGKEEGKERIQNAIFGMILALSSYIILQTIDRSFTRSDIKMETLEVTVEDPQLMGPSGEGVVKGEVNEQTLSPGDVGYPYSPEDPRYGTVVKVGGESVIGGTSDGTLKGSKFANREWYDHALSLVNTSQLPTLKPADAAQYFPNGVVTAEGWVNLLAGITAKESNFKPGLTYTEKFKDRNGNNVISTGLLQLSQESARAYGFTGITTEDLKDPKKNLEVGIKILEKWVAQDGVIASGSTNKDAKGGARYWSTLRKK